MTLALGEIEGFKEGEPMTISRVYETLLTRVSVRKMGTDGDDCGAKVVGYEFEPPTHGLPYVVYFPGGNVFRTSHVEGIQQEGSDVIVRTRNSTYRVVYPHGKESKTTTDLERLMGGAAPRAGRGGTNLTATQELPARRISLTALERGGAWGEEKELTGWETAPPQEGEPYVAYLERGGILQTSTVQEVQETDDGVLLRTRNSVYQVKYLGGTRG